MKVGQAIAEVLTRHMALPDASIPRVFPGYTPQSAPGILRA